MFYLILFLAAFVLIARMVPALLASLYLALGWAVVIMAVIVVVRLFKGR